MTAPNASGPNSIRFPSSLDASPSAIIGRAVQLTRGAGLLLLTAPAVALPVVRRSPRHAYKAGAGICEARIL